MKTAVVKKDKPMWKKSVMHSDQHSEDEKRGRILYITNTTMTLEWPKKRKKEITGILTTIPQTGHPSKTAAVDNRNIERAEV